MLKKKNNLKNIIFISLTIFFLIIVSKYFATQTCSLMLTVPKSITGEILTVDGSR